MSHGVFPVQWGHFLVFHRDQDPVKAARSTIFASMMFLRIRIVDNIDTCNAVVEGYEDDIAALVGTKEWSYKPLQGGEAGAL